MRERVVRFGSERQLIGLVAEPTTGDAPATDIGVVFLNSGLLHRVGASRLHVRLARRLAALGVPSIRFDFSAIGDSDGRTDGLPFERSAVSETMSAIDEMTRLLGTKRFVTFGLCSGADIAFWTSLEDARVIGTIQLDPFVYRTWRWYASHLAPRLLRGSSWLNMLRGRGIVGKALRKRYRVADIADTEPGDENVVVNPYARAFPDRKLVTQGLTQLAQRGVEQLAILSMGQPEHVNHGRQYLDSFASVPFGRRLRVEWRPTADHVFTRLEEQQFVIATVVEWMRERILGGVANPTGSAQSATPA